ncbi:unnamed protein product [Amoebophrya sp. A25]|nr:unnamed protein product [Amoebophrya sp. A25]|eukprot:GSA25T00022829001.1
MPSVRTLHPGGFRPSGEQWPVEQSSIFLDVKREHSSSSSPSCGHATKNDPIRGSEVVRTCNSEFIPPDDVDEQKLQGTVDQLVHENFFHELYGMEDPTHVKGLPPTVHSATRSSWGFAAFCFAWGVWYELRTCLGRMSNSGGGEQGSTFGFGGGFLSITWSKLLEVALHGLFAYLLVTVRARPGYFRGRRVSPPIAAALGVEGADESRVAKETTSTGKMKEGPIQEDVLNEDQRAQLRPLLNRYRYCKHCEHFQPIRCRHCKSCGYCVLTFDHHCFWLGGSIGERNHRRFVIFLFIGSIVCLLHVQAILFPATSTDHDTTSTSDHHDTVGATITSSRTTIMTPPINTSTRTATSTSDHACRVLVRDILSSRSPRPGPFLACTEWSILGSTALGFASLFLGLLLYHGYLIATAQTTAEHWTGRAGLPRYLRENVPVDVKHPFSAKTTRENCWEFFGGRFASTSSLSGPPDCEEQILETTARQREILRLLSAIFTSPTNAKKSLPLTFCSTSFPGALQEVEDTTPRHQHPLPRHEATPSSEDRTRLLEMTTTTFKHDVNYDHEDFVKVDLDVEERQLVLDGGTVQIGSDRRTKMLGSILRPDAEPPRFAKQCRVWQNGDEIPFSFLDNEYYSCF